MKKENLTNSELAIVSAHTIMRFLMGYKPHERTNAIEQMLKKISKFLRHRKKTNLKIFTFATEFERVLWQNVTDKYDKHTKIFALGFTIDVYSYYGDHIKKFVKISEALVETIGVQQSMTEVESTLAYEIEQNDNDLLSTYVKALEPYTGIALRKSLFAGKKLTIKNNLIVEGKELASGF